MEKKVEVKGSQWKKGKEGKEEYTKESKEREMEKEV